MSLLFFLFPLHCGIALGQDLQGSVDHLVSGLSVKRDNDLVQYRSVVNALQNLDSARYCEVLKTLKDEGPRKNPRYWIRFHAIESQLMLNKKVCPGSKPGLELLKEALQLAYEVEDDHLRFLIHNLMSNYYTNSGDYGLAAMHILTAEDVYLRSGHDDFRFNAYGWFGLGYALFHARDYVGSIQANKKALGESGRLSIHQADTLSTSYQINAWNTIGLAFDKVEKPDSAVWAFRQALAMAENGANAFWKGVIIGNIGDVFFQMGRFDSAEVNLKVDYKQSMAASQFDNAANSLQWLARIQLHQSNAHEALRMLYEAGRLLEIMPQPTYTANLLYAFTQVFTKLQKADSVNYYMHQYLMLHDSLEKKAHDNRMELVRIRMDNQAYSHTIMSLSKEKHRIALIRNFIILVIVFMAITGYLILNRQKLRLRLRQQEALEQKRTAEKNASQAIEQLHVFTHHLREKTKLVEKLQEQLLNRELNAEQIQRIEELSHHTILTDEDWENFKNLFEKVYPGFFLAVKQGAADITLAELRMASLCKLQIPSKEAGNLLGISTNSVHKTRQRLRHRLGLEPNADLNVYFSRDFAF